MSIPEPLPRAEDASSGSLAQGAGCRWKAAIVILSLAGGGLVLLSTAKYGAGLSADSVAYLDAARSLVSGRGLVFNTGEPMVSWPPLYPMLLALVSAGTGLDPVAFAHIVNSILFFLVIYLSARLFRTGCQWNTAYSLLGTCAVLVSVPLSGVYGMAWSECLFIPLVLLYLVSAQRYWDSRGVLSLAVMIASTALACLTRYIGVALVPAGVVTIVLASGVNFKVRSTRAFVFLALALAPLGLWLLRNSQLTGTLSGGRGPSAYTYAENAILCARTVLLWYVPKEGAEFIVPAGIVIALVAIVLIWTARRRIRCNLKPSCSDYLPAVLLSVTYTSILLLAANATVLDEIGDRFLSPIYVPSTLILMKLGSHLFGALPRRTAAFVVRVPSALLAIWLCFPLVSVARSTIGRIRNGAGGYSTREWHESKTVAYASQMSSVNNDVDVYSNAPDALLTLANVGATDSPHRAGVRLRDLRGRWPTKNGSVLVWFKKKSHREYLFSLEELRQISSVEEVTRFSDGSVYRVSIQDTVAPDWSLGTANGDAPLDMTPARRE